MNRITRKAFIRPWLLLFGLLSLALAACAADSPASIPPASAVSATVSVTPQAMAATPVIVSGPPGGTRAAQPGVVAPYFGWRENGVDQSLSHYREQPVILNWWASWCEPCRSEIPLLTNAAQDKTNLAKGLVIIGINLKESESEVMDFARRYSPGFKLLRDQDALLSAAYTLRGLPQTVFINRNGVIKAIIHGPLTAQSLEENIRLAVET